MSFILTEYIKVLYMYNLLRFIFIVRKCIHKGEAALVQICK